jgi:Pyruvate/2-oxoacid:ferredoxin oxidoreductase delta subunit
MKIPFIKASTQEFIKEARQTPNYGFWDFVHGYIYGRWIYQYIDLGTGRHPLAKKIGKWTKKLGIAPEKKPDTASRGMAETYHGKAVPLKAATQLVQINEPINLPDLEQVIPYKRARSIVMKNPEHIVALDCPCRSAKENPFLPIDVCLVVGDPFANFIREHHPERSRDITPDEAVAILKAEDERGHVHHAFFKDAMLERFYAICNCCECCCGAINSHKSGNPMLASSGYVAQIEEDECIACEACVDYCQFNALKMDEESFTMSVVYENCMGCGICVDKCDQASITLVADQSKGIPLEICALMEQAI